MRVFGIDPGSLNLGWGFIEIDKQDRILKVEHGCLQWSGKEPFLQRLPKISAELGLLLEKHQPQVTVIEKIFLGKNVDSAFKLGHVRGVCAVQCQRVGSDIVEYTARTVKKQITGQGQAEKQVVQSFLYHQLKPSEKFLTQDASDALALAFCHILQDSVQRRMGRMREL